MIIHGVLSMEKSVRSLPRRYLFKFLIVLLLVLSPYSVVFVVEKATLHSLSLESGPFEIAGAVFFLAAAVLFFFSAHRVKDLDDGRHLTRRLTFFFLGVFALCAFGEEINWGQHIFGIQTPGFLEKINAQKELNIHNLKVFYYWKDNREGKTGWELAFTAKSLFTYFWMVYCFLVPLVVALVKPVRRLIGRIDIPVIPLWIGVLFLINYEVKKVIPHYRVLQRQNDIEEIFECIIAFLFMLAAWALLKKSAKGGIQEEGDG